MICQNQQGQNCDDSQRGGRGSEGGKKRKKKEEEEEGEEEKERREGRAGEGKGGERTHCFWFRSQAVFLPWNSETPPNFIVSSPFIC